MLPLLFFGLLMGTVGQQHVQISDVPKPGDPALEGRFKLCPNAAAESGVSRSNEMRASVEQLFGTLTAVEIHQFGSKFSDFGAVEKYVRALLSQRPRGVSRYQSWANLTALEPEGVLGTLRFANGVSGVFEATGPYVCVQDSMSQYWWLRLAPVDVW